MDFAPRRNAYLDGPTCLSAERTGSGARRPATEISVTRRSCFSQSARGRAGHVVSPELPVFDGYQTWPWPVSPTSGRLPGLRHPAVDAAHRRHVADLAASERRRRCGNRKRNWNNTPSPWKASGRPWSNSMKPPNPQPAQERIPGQHEPRDPHAHDGHPRLRRHPGRATGRSRTPGGPRTSSAAMATTSSRSSTTSSTSRRSKPENSRSSGRPVRRRRSRPKSFR